MRRHTHTIRYIRYVCSESIYTHAQPHISFQTLSANGWPKMAMSKNEELLWIYIMNEVTLVFLSKSIHHVLFYKDTAKCTAATIAKHRRNPGHQLARKRNPAWSSFKWILPLWRRDGTFLQHAALSWTLFSFFLSRILHLSREYAILPRELHCIEAWLYCNAFNMETVLSGFLEAHRFVSRILFRQSNAALLHKCCSFF